MEYVTLDTNPVINGITYSSFVHILNIENNMCNVLISNSDIICNQIAITNNDIEQSVKDYFNNI